MSQLTTFLRQYPDAEYMTDVLVAFDENDNQIDILENLQSEIREHLENSPENVNGEGGIEIVDRMGGYRNAFDEIRGEI
jgi:hypothetical protein